MAREKVITMPTSINHLTTICDGDIMEKVKAMREKFIAEKLPALIEKYGDMNLETAEKIAYAEKQIAECGKCTGLPCERTRMTNCTPSISFTEKFGVEVRFNVCKFILAENRQKSFGKKFQSAKIPLQYRGKNFSDFKITAENSDAVKAAKNFLENPTGGIFFFGNPGTGKTFLAAIIAQEFLKNHYSVIFGDVPSLLDDLKSTFDDKNKSLDDLMDSLTAADLLVLDDLGTEVPTEWACERIYLIINQRYNAEKPMIVTSNFRLGEIGRRMNKPKKRESAETIVTGNRIVSRLAQMCNRVELRGEDWRLKNVD